jgi:hypothetical protein
MTYFWTLLSTRKVWLSLVIAIVALFGLQGCLLAPGVTAVDPSTITPNMVTLERGQSHTFQVTVTTADLGEALLFESEGGLSFDPAEIRGAPLPFTRDVTVTVLPDTEYGSQRFKINRASGDELASASVNVVASAPPGFSFTASKNLVVTPITTFSEPVTFTLTSEGGFSGTVSINWADIFGAVPSDPTPRPFEVTISPGEPATFVRKFYRFEPGDADIPIVFTATSGLVSKSQTVNVRDSGG